MSETFEGVEMARTKRFKINGDVGYYHVISRTVEGKWENKKGQVNYA